MVQTLMLPDLVSYAGPSFEINVCFVIDLINMRSFVSEGICVGPMAGGLNVHNESLMFIVCHCTCWWIFELYIQL